MRNFKSTTAFAFSLLLSAIVPHAQAFAAVNSCTVTANYSIISGGTKVHVVEQCFENNGNPGPTYDQSLKCPTTQSPPIAAIVEVGTTPSQLAVGCGGVPNNAATILNSPASATFVVPHEVATSYLASSAAIPNHAPAQLIGSASCPDGMLAVIGISLTTHSGFTGCYSASAAPPLTAAEISGD